MSGREEKEPKKKKKTGKGRGAKGLWCLSHKRHLMKDRERSHLQLTTYNNQPLKTKIPGKDHKARQERCRSMKMASENLPSVSLNDLSAALLLQTFIFSSTRQTCEQCPRLPLSFPHSTLYTLSASSIKQTLLGDTPHALLLSITLHFLQ